MSCLETVNELSTLNLYFASGGSEGTVLSPVPERVSHRNQLLLNVRSPRDYVGSFAPVVLP